MSSLDNFLKYIIAIAEHGQIFVVPITRPMSEAEVESYLSMYPINLEKKFSLICSPYSEPEVCRLIGSDTGFVCESTKYTKKVICYNTVTGELYNSTDSQKIFEALKKAHKLCGLRVILHVNNKFAPPKVSAVPQQGNPVPPKDVVEPGAGNAVDELKRIIEKLRAEYGTPPNTAPPTPPKPPPIPPEKKYSECIQLANDFGYHELKDAIASGNKEKMLSALRGLADLVLQSDKALIDYAKYSRLIKLCEKEIRE